MLTVSGDTSHVPCILFLYIGNFSLLSCRTQLDVITAVIERGFNQGRHVCVVELSFPLPFGFCVTYKHNEDDDDEEENHDEHNNDDNNDNHDHNGNDDDVDIDYNCIPRCMFF